MCELSLDLRKQKRTLKHFFFFFSLVFFLPFWLFWFSCHQPWPSAEFGLQRSDQAPKRWFTSARAYHVAELMRTALS